jgi:hypothetical protein
VVIGWAWRMFEIPLVVQLTAFHALIKGLLRTIYRL